MSYLHVKYPHYSQLLSAARRCSSSATLTTKLRIPTPALTSSRRFQNAVIGERMGIEFGEWHVGGRALCLLGPCLCIQNGDAVRIRPEYTRCKLPVWCHGEG